MAVRRVVAIVLVAAAGFAASVTALRGDDSPTPDEVLDSPEVRELLAILESETFRGGDYAELRSEAATQLDRVVADGGEALRDAALRRMRELHGDERRRAELVLAQAATVPPESVRALLSSDDPELGTWAWLNLSRRKDAGEAPPWSVDPPSPLRPVDLGPARDPLLDVHAQIRDALPGFEMSGTRTTLRRDDEEPEGLRLLRHDTDLDGDGISEELVAAETAEEYPRSVFLAVLRRDSADAPWTLAGLRVSEWGHDEVIVTDLDGDGRDDVAVASTIPASPTLSELSVWSHADRRFVDLGPSYHAAVLILRRAPREPAVLVTRWPYKDNYGGTAISLVGVCATEFQLWRWDGRKVDEVGAAYLAFDD